MCVAHAARSQASQRLLKYGSVIIMVDPHSIPHYRIILMFWSAWCMLWLRDSFTAIDTCVCVVLLQCKKTDPYFVPQLRLSRARRWNALRPQRTSRCCPVEAPTITLLYVYARPNRETPPNQTPIYKVHDATSQRAHSPNTHTTWLCSHTSRASSPSKHIHDITIIAAIRRPWRPFPI